VQESSHKQLLCGCCGGTCGIVLVTWQASESMVSVLPKSLLLQAHCRGEWMQSQCIFQRDLSHMRNKRSKIIMKFLKVFL